MNKKTQTRNSFIYLDDQETDKINLVENLHPNNSTKNTVYHNDRSVIFSDVVSNDSSSLKYQKSAYVCKYPEVVCSNSLLDEKFFNIKWISDIHVLMDQPKFGPSLSISSNSSKPIASSSEKTSPINSVNPNNNEIKSKDTLISRVGDNATNCVEESERYTKLEHTDNDNSAIQSHQSHENDIDNGKANIDLSSEKVVKTTSSSEYCTESRESTKENFAPKPSICKPQEPLFQGKSAISQSTNTSTTDNKPISYIDKRSIAKNGESSSVSMSDLKQSRVQTNQKSGISQLKNLDSSAIETTESQLSNMNGITKFDFAVTSQEVKCKLALPEKHQIQKPIKEVSECDKIINIDTSSHEDQKISQQKDMPIAGLTSQSHGHTTTTIISQQHLVHDKNKMANNDTQHHLSERYIQCHPINNGSLIYNQFHTSSSASGSHSCFIPSSVEEKWRAAPHSHVSLLKLYLLQSDQGGSDFSRESTLNLESLLKDNKPGNQVSMDLSQQVYPASSQTLPNFDKSMANNDSTNSSMIMSSLDGQFDKSFMDRLQRSVHCDESDCPNAHCKQIKNTLAVLQNPENHVNFLPEADKLLLLAMFRHTTEVCDHPKCPFPWCGETIGKIGQLSHEEQLMVMKEFLENFAEHFLFFGQPRKYMKLQSTLPFDSIPVEGHDWDRLCMLGSSKRALLVQCVKSKMSGLTSDNGYWVIKKISTIDDGDHWGVYSRLRDVEHKSIATFLWAASFDDHMLTCSLFEGLALYDYLPLSSQKQYIFVSVFDVMSQLISASSHLHKLGIVYLNWTSKNILVTYTNNNEVIKLGNFSCSVLLEPPDGKEPCYDGGHLLLALPRHIITPELRDFIMVDYTSDVWGLGCLLHELVTGQPVWYEYRHKLDSEFKLLTMKKPSVPNLCTELVSVFFECWETDSKKRIQLSDLEIMLIKAYQIHLMS